MLGIFAETPVYHKYKAWEMTKRRINRYPSLFSSSQLMSGGILSPQLLTSFMSALGSRGRPMLRALEKSHPTSQKNYISLVTCIWTHLPFKNKPLYKSPKQHMVSSHRGLIIAYIILFLKSVLFWIIGAPKITLKNSGAYQSCTLEVGNPFFFFLTSPKNNNNKKKIPASKTTTFVCQVSAWNTFLQYL